MMKNASKNFTEYRVDISGNLENHWSDWFDGFSIRQIQNDPYVTRLQGFIRDQAALRNLLEKIWDLNLEIIQVERLGSLNNQS